jgi:hypothetical protein
MKGNGEAIIEMAEDLRGIAMVTGMREILRKISRMDRVFTPGLMAKSMKENGRTA